MNGAHRTGVNRARTRMLKGAQRTLAQNNLNLPVLQRLTPEVCACWVRAATAASVNWLWTAKAAAAVRMQCVQYRQLKHACKARTFIAHRKLMAVPVIASSRNDGSQPCRGSTRCGE
eukprot:364319-Chlamydomonas_euryale.AAC.2